MYAAAAAKNSYLFHCISVAIGLHEIF